ncbi:MAG: ribonuclease P protein component [Bacteroidota bacterium]
MDQRFGKGYRLCSKKAIDALFKCGKRLKKYPLAVRYECLPLPTSKRFQVVISVPKRIHKTAPKRNRLKRLIREGVRKNKHIIEERIPRQGTQMGIAIIYQSKEEVEQSKIENCVEHLFREIIKRSNQ